MRVAIDISQIAYTGTGIETYTRQLVISLMRTHPEVNLILYGFSLRQHKKLTNFLDLLSNDFVRESAKIFWLPSTVLSLLWNRVHRIPIETFINHVDLVHTSDWTEPPSHMPKVTTIHDLMIFKYPENFPSAIIDNHKAKLFWVKKESKLVIADSESTKRDIIEYLQIPESKIRVIYLGVDAQFFPQTSESVLRIKKRYGIRKDYLLCVGTQEPRKNLFRIAQAFKQLNSHAIELIIVGNPGWGNPIRGNENIKVVGYVENKDLVSLYSGAIAFIYPSLYEGFGLPLLEAMASGTPVLTSNRGSLAEIAGNFAHTINPDQTEDLASGIKFLVDMPESRRKEMIQKGVHHARTFTWEKTAEQLYHVYQEIVEGL